ncbi:MAG: hypothetical protein A2808_03820 [Candidatus Moranbacteria bacterium RIFCSPHIGHO2_01_FULL_55_24]|nr:MAG: hypothetical protein A2808_03820 [Candidatus Moranbacteria bacterium RIFCSPHIGHO2_01_FULL_55_24]
MAKKQGETVLEVPAGVTPAAETTPQNNERFFGMLLLSAFFIFALASLIGAGWGAYLLWQNRAKTINQPSIASVTVGEAMVETAPKTEEKPAGEAASAPAASGESVTKAKATQMSVLNGGAAKGTAGTAGELLKSAGFTKITVGNTQADFTGTTVYYAAGLEKEAAAVADALRSKYPNVAPKPAEASNKETSTASLTVIFGK